MHICILICIHTYRDCAKSANLLLTTTVVQRLWFCCRSETPSRILFDEAQQQWGLGKTHQLFKGCHGKILMFWCQFKTRPHNTPIRFLAVGDGGPYRLPMQPLPLVSGGQWLADYCSLSSLCLGPHSAEHDSSSELQSLVCLYLGALIFLWQLKQSYQPAHSPHTLFFFLMTLSISSYKCLNVILH